MRNFIVGLCMALVTGCASMATPETVNQKIAYVYAGLTAAADSTTDLLKRDRISVKTAQSISADLDTGHFLVQSARLAQKGNKTADAYGYISKAQELLVIVETKLKAGAANGSN